MNLHPSLRFAPLFALFLALAPYSTADAQQETRRLAQSYFAGDVDKLEIDLFFGSVTVRGTEGRNAKIEMIITCDRADDVKCFNRANRILLEPKISGRTLALRLRGTTRGQVGGIQAEMVVEAPRDLELEVDMAGGNVTVQGMRNHIEIDSGGGDVDLVGFQDLVQTFKADVGFGEAHLWLREGHIEGSGFPRSIKWRGSGSIEIEVDLGGGDLDARLE